MAFTLDAKDPTADVEAYLHGNDLAAAIVNDFQGLLAELSEKRLLPIAGELARLFRVAADALEADGPS